MWSSTVARCIVFAFKLKTLLVGSKLLSLDCLIEEGITFKGPDHLYDNDTIHGHELFQFQSAENTQDCASFAHNLTITECQGACESHWTWGPVSKACLVFWTKTYKRKDDETHRVVSGGSICSIPAPGRNFVLKSPMCGS